jgi:hypothetical protein
LEVLVTQHGVHTDAETLQTQPFDFMPDDELRELIES